MVVARRKIELQKMFWLCDMRIGNWRPLQHTEQLVIWVSHFMVFAYNYQKL